MANASHPTLFRKHLPANMSTFLRRKEESLVLEFFVFFLYFFTLQTPMISNKLLFGMRRVIFIRWVCIVQMGVRWIILNCNETKDLGLPIIIWIGGELTDWAYTRVHCGVHFLKGGRRGIPDPSFLLMLLSVVRHIGVTQPGRDSGLRQKWHIWHQI